MDVARSSASRVLLRAAAAGCVVLASLSALVLIWSAGEVGGYADDWGWKYWAVPAVVIMPALATGLAAAAAVLLWRGRGVAVAQLLIVLWLALVGGWIFLPLGK